MSNYCEPRVSTRVKNPTKTAQNYRWLSDGVFALDPGQEIVFPFEVMTAAKAEGRPIIEEDIRSGNAQMEYLVRGITVTQVDSLPMHRTTTDVPAPPTPLRPDGAAIQPDLFPQEHTKDGMSIFKKSAVSALDVPKTGPQVKTFREVMGWPKQEAAPAAPVQTLQEAWTDRIKHPKF